MLHIHQTSGWSALFFAAKDGHLEITKALLNAGADPMLKDKVWLWLVILYSIAVFRILIFIILSCLHFMKHTPYWPGSLQQWIAVLLYTSGCVCYQTLRHKNLVNHWDHWQFHTFNSIILLIQARVLLYIYIYISEFWAIHNEIIYDSISHHTAMA